MIDPRAVKHADAGCDVAHDHQFLPAAQLFNDLCVDIPTEEDVFIRRIELKSLTPRDMTPNQPQAEFRVRVLPENAMHQEVSYSIRNAEGVEMP